MPAAHASSVATGGLSPAAEAREAMIESQLKPCGVVTPRVVAAFYAIAREEYVHAARQGLAYVDAPQPLGGGRELPAPLTLGRLIEALQPAAGERALVIGAGSGYAAAVLARLTAHVVAVEEDATLAGQARKLLASHANIRVVEAPLTAGHAEGAPYDIILFDGAIACEPPAGLIAQLAPTGRAAAVIVDAGGVARAAIGKRSGDHLLFEPFASAPAAILPGFQPAPAFQF